MVGETIRVIGEFVMPIVEEILNGNKEENL
jgi:hypothetical protein